MLHVSFQVPGVIPGVFYRPKKFSFAELVAPRLPQIFEVFLVRLFTRLRLVSAARFDEPLRPGDSDLAPAERTNEVKVAAGQHDFDAGLAAVRK
jgi:hypothetical protein